MNPYPAFDQPTFTVADETVFAVDETGLPSAAPLDSLTEPDDQPRVTNPSDEPLVTLDHERVSLLTNYWHAGWKTAVAETFMRASAAARLYAVADALPPEWGLAVFDAWRPLSLQQELFDAAYVALDLDRGFMAPPSSDPRTPPPHLTGGTVDLTLTWRTTPLGLGTGFDDTTAAAHTAGFESTPGVTRDLRRYLVAAMNAQDFVVYQDEWWHFEYGTRRWAAITGKPALFGAAQPD